MKIYPNILAGFLLSVAGVSAAHAADCSLEWEATRRDACEQYNDESQWNDSQSKRLIDRYNNQQQQEAQERLREEQEAQAAASRQEEVRRAAAEEERLRPQREQAAIREWLRELDRQDANKRFWEQHRKQEAVRLQRIRARVETRLRAETARLLAPGAAPMTADDYDRLVTLSIPEWDLMRYWADAGLKRFPSEFAYRHAVVQSIGCAGRTYAKQALEIPGDCPLPSNPPATLMTTSSPFLPERAIACGYRYLHWRTFKLAFVPQGGDKMYLPGPFRAWSAAELAEGEREARERWQQAQACEVALGPQGQVLHDTLLARMNLLVGNYDGAYPLLEAPTGWGAYRRWYLVSRTVWGARPDWQDAAVVNRILDQAEQAYNAHEPEWSYLEGGMNDTGAN